MAEFGASALQASDLQALFEEAVRRVSEAVGVAYTSLLEHRADADELVLRAGWSWSGLIGTVTQPASLPTAASSALRTGRPATVGDTGQAAEFEHPPFLRQQGILSLAAVPIRTDRETFGVLEIESETPRQFDEACLEFLTGIASFLGSAIGRHRAQEILADQLKVSGEALFQARKMEAVGQLTAGLAHDFNNFLTVIAGNLDLLERRINSEPALLRLVRSASQAAASGEKLTQQLLAFARKQQLRPELVSLNEVVSDVLEILRRGAGESALVNTSFALERLPVLIDRNQLETSLLNLVVNARDAMPPDKVGEITVETSKEVTCPPAVLAASVHHGRCIRLTVRDTGTGMSPEVAARVFEPFFSTKPLGKGTGLGLSMVFGFITQSGGCVTVETEEGLGTAFHILLPEADDAELTETAAARVSDEPRGGEEVVLVAEDNPDVRALAVSVLEQLGYVTLQAENGTEALQILERERHIDLLFTDVVMPNGPNGIELAELARGRWPNLPVIMTSGYSTEQVGGELAKDRRFLRKPYRPADLALTVQGLLEPALAAETG